MVKYNTQYSGYSDTSCGTVWVLVFLGLAVTAIVIATGQYAFAKNAFDQLTNGLLGGL